MCTVSAGPYVHERCVRESACLYIYADISELKQNTDADFSLQIAVC